MDNKLANIQGSGDFLEKYIRPGDTIYSVFLHKSASGMKRTFKFLIPINGKIVDISLHITNILSNTRYDEKHEGLSIMGCGMDMALAVIYDLSAALFESETQLKHRAF